MRAGGAIGPQATADGDSPTRDRLLRRRRPAGPADAS